MALRKPIVLLMTVASLLMGLMLGTTASASAAQRIDMKVLLLGTSTTQPDFTAWQGALQREGVPFEAIVTSPGHAPITAATLTNGTSEAKYQAIIVSAGALPECTESGCISTLTPTEWAALEEYETTFSIRQLTGDIFPSTTYGLNGPTISGALDGTEATLTSDGKSIFPYLNGPVGMDTGTFGYQATPLSSQAAGASFDTLLSGPNGSALAGIYTRPSGAQELVETFNENQYQLQAELLRHGALNWATRGVYLGDQRNYYEAHIDDNFLSDDSWNKSAHETDYNPADALRETPTDVENAAKWSAQNNFRIDMLFNGGGSVQYQEEHAGSDPLLSAFQKAKGSFGWISHTWDHPNIDIGCASQSYIESELNENNIWGASTLGLAESTSPTAALGNDNPSVIITGEHSGLANLIPGNPGVVDPPDLNSVETATGGALPAGTYVYAVTDDFVAGGGQSIASISSPVTVTDEEEGEASVEVTWPAVCHAAQFKIYREVAGSNQWKLIATIPPPSAEPPNSWFASPTTNLAVTGGGALQQKFIDTGAAGTPSAAPPASNEAVETAYPQNPNLIPAFQGVGIQDFGADASKPYPNPAIPGSTTAAYAAGSTFADGGAEAVPRYPTNIYYNVSTEAEEVDEFNTLYTPVAQGGKCVASAVTTCETKPATFAEVVSDVDTNMFQHVMGNDPRPHYFHQPNIMGTPPAGPATTGTPPGTSPSVGDGLFYSVLNPLLEEYKKYFSAPIEQPTMAQIGQVLAEQAAWNAALSAGKVSGYIEANRITIQNSGAASVSIPLTGVSGVGSLYGGIQSGWTNVPSAGATYTTPTPWPGSAPLTEAPVVTTNPAAKTVTAGESATFTAAASGAPTPTVQWQLSTNGGATFANDTTDAGNTTGTLTVASTTTALSGRQYRAVFTNSAGSATSTAAALTVSPKPEAPKLITNPVAKTVTAGESATFTAAASGVATPTVQWQLSTNGGATFANDSTDAGNTTGTLTVASTTTALSGRQYRAVFTNASGSATTTGAALTVNVKPEAPKVTTNPVSKAVTATASTTFTAAASGVPAPSVQWQVSTNGGATFANDTTDAGNTSATLSVASTTVALNARQYRAVFTNSAGTATTTAATLTVTAKPEAPKVTTNPASKTVTAGESTTFTAAASGVPTPTVRWQVSTNGGRTFANDATDSGNTTTTLTVLGTSTAQSAREYRAVFTNASGTATTAVATLTVKVPAPTVTGVSPNSGSSRGLVTVTGKNFTNVQSVSFGGLSAGGFVLSSTQILVLVPNGTGTVDVTVTTASGTSATSSADRFTYTKGR
jgi:hypothetical protein